MNNTMLVTDNFTIVTNIDNLDAAMLMQGIMPLNDGEKASLINVKSYNFDNPTQKGLVQISFDKAGFDVNTGAK